MCVHVVDLFYQVCFDAPKPSLDYNNNNNNDIDIESLCEYSERGAIDDHT